MGQSTDNYTLMQLSTIIVTWNSEEYIETCLRSVIDATAAVKSEIFVVDNKSSDTTTEVIKKLFPQVKLISLKTNKGFGVANNIGIAQATGDKILLLNPDTSISSKVVNQLMAFLDKDSQIGAVGPEQLGNDNSIIFTYSRLTIRGIFDYIYKKYAPFSLKFLDTYFTVPRRVTFLNLGCVMTSKEIWETGLVFDKNLFLYGEELDLFLKIKQLHKKVFFLPGISMYHYREKSMNLTGKKGYFVTQSYLKLLKKALGFIK